VAIIYQYPGCSTCRKALKWLDAHGVTYTRQDLVAQPIEPDALRSLWRRSGLPLRKLFNTAGRSYREGGFKDRLPTMSEEEAIAALAADGKLVKRPILDTGETVLVGFREAEYAKLR